MYVNFKIMLVLIACDWHASESTCSRKVMESDLFTPSITVNKRMTQPFILLDFRMLQIASVL